MTKKVERKLNKKFIYQISSYGFIGVLGTITHTSVLWYLVEYKSLNTLLSSALGFFLSLIISYLLNTLLTFKSQFTYEIFVKYCIVSLMGLLLNLLILYTTEKILTLPYMLGQGVSIFLVPLLNFMLNRYWTFRTALSK